MKFSRTPLAFSALLAVAGSAFAQKGETIKLAWIDPLSGLMAPVGNNMLKTFQYFVDKYGEWILLAPRPRGFTLLVWLVPALGVVLGVAILVLRLRRYRPRATSIARRPDAAMQERIRKELEAQP